MTIISPAIFRSYSDGNFDEKNDIDFLIVNPNQKKIFKAAKRLE